MNNQTLPQIPGYTLFRQIGHGGMASIYLAQDQASNATVAIKIMHSSRAQDPDLVRRFENEAKIYRELDVEQVVKVHKLAKMGQLPYIVMEFLDGHDVKKYLQSNQYFKAQDAVWLVSETAVALAAAEKRRIVHRDIKPANIQITKDEKVKVLDFGIAKTEDSHTVIGFTPHYASPELCNEDRLLDIRSDIYSLGIVLYELLSGELPFPGQQHAAIIHKHLHEPVPDILPRIKDATCPEEAKLKLKLVVEKATQKSPSKRYQSPVEMVRDLAKVFPESPKITQTGLLKLPQKKIDPRLRWGMVAGLLALVGLGLGARAYAHWYQTALITIKVQPEERSYIRIDQQKEIPAPLTTSLPTGPHTLSINNSDYQSQTLKLELLPRQEITQNIVLQPTAVYLESQGDKYYAQGNVLEAIKKYQRLRELYPQNTRGSKGLSMIYYNEAVNSYTLKSYDMIEHYLQEIEPFTQNESILSAAQMNQIALLHNAMGAYYSKKGKAFYPQAQQFYLKALKIMPNHPDENLFQQNLAKVKSK